MPPTVIKHDRSPVADLKRPFNTRLYKNSSAAGSIELAYERGRQTGAEDERERCAKIAEKWGRAGKLVAKEIRNDYLAPGKMDCRKVSSFRRLRRTQNSPMANQPMTDVTALAEKYGLSKCGLGMEFHADGSVTTWFSSVAREETGCVSIMPPGSSVAWGATPDEAIRNSFHSIGVEVPRANL